jgi:hypothetical protein
MVGPVKPRPPVFFAWVLGRGRSVIVPAPRPSAGVGDAPGHSECCLMVSWLWFRKASSWKGPRGPVASDFATTVDQSDIRHLCFLGSATALAASVWIEPFRGDMQKTPLFHPHNGHFAEGVYHPAMAGQRVRLGTLLCEPSSRVSVPWAARGLPQQGSKRKMNTPLK